MIASLKSGRSSLLLDVIVGLLYPIISLQVRKVQVLVCYVNFLDTVFAIWLYYFCVGYESCLLFLK